MNADIMMIQAMLCWILSDTIKSNPKIALFWDILGMYLGVLSIVIRFL